LTIEELEGTLPNGFHVAWRRTWAGTLIQTMLESSASVAWNSHWLISKLDSGVDYEYYANEMRVAGNARGNVQVVSCGVLADSVAVAALRGSAFQLSWYSELYLFTDAPRSFPPPAEQLRKKRGW